MNLTPREAVLQLYAARNALREAFPGLPFPLDGKLVGDIGEAIARAHWHLHPLPAGTKTHDGTDGHERRIQIKTTQQSRPASPVGLGLDKRSFEHLIVIQLRENASFTVLFDGPGSRIDEERQHKKSASLSVRQLQQLDRLVEPSERVLPAEQREGQL
jgi:hypothetical protein